MDLIFSPLSVSVEINAFILEHEPGMKEPTDAYDFKRQKIVQVWSASFLFDR